MLGVRRLTSGCWTTSRRAAVQPHAGLATAAATRPTAEEMAAYRRDGVVLLKGALPPDQIALAEAAATGAAASPGPYAEFIGAGVDWNSMFDGDAAGRDWTMFQDQFASRRVPEMASLASTSVAGQMIAALMGSETAAFFYDHTIIKRPSSVDEACIPWHQDLPYWRIDGEHIGSIWIPLDKMSAEAGVTWILGSHRWGLFQPRHFVDATPYEGTAHLPSMPDIDEMIASGDAASVAFEVEPGDLLAFDARIIHGSRGNTETDQLHRRIALRFGGDDAVYCERDGETAIPTADVQSEHDRLHGDPIACDVFPLVWPRA